MSKYALPSTDEMRQLHAADPASAFHSNFFRMQIDQLLEEISVPYPSFSSVGQTLFAIKEIFDALPEQQVTPACLEMPGLVVCNYHKPVVLPFCSPARLDVLGSYTLRHGIKREQILSIDIAVQMPDSCFVPKDFLNFRYHDKRNMYLGVLAAEIKKHPDTLCGSLSLQGFARSDVAKPVLVVTLPKKVKGTTVRVLIYPVISSTTFAVSKLHPGKSNLKHLHRHSHQHSATDPGDTPSSTGRATPRYNNAILEDMRMLPHLHALHTMASQSPSFVQACCLLKVWLHQRRLDESPDGLNSFQASMLLLYLLQTGKIASLTTSADTMFKVWLHFIATYAFASSPLVFPPDNDCDIVPTEAGLSVFAKHFDIVFLDGSARLNLMSRVSRAAMAELQWLAQASWHDIQHGMTARSFHSLFLEHHSVWTRYDEYLSIRIPPPTAASSSSSSTKWNAILALTSHSTRKEENSNDDEGDDIIYHAHALDMIVWPRQLTQLLTQALGNRIYRVTPIVSLPHWCLTHALHPWSITRDDNVVMLRFGISLNPEHACRRVDKGPDAGDKIAASSFRAFWKEKAELRRFKDGTILEAVVWDEKDVANPPDIVHSICQYVVQTHFRPYMEDRKMDKEVNDGDDNHAKDDSGKTLVVVSSNTTLLEADQDRAIFASQVPQLQKVWNGLSTVLRNLNDVLPLRVKDIQPISPAFRYTSAEPPMAHPLASQKPIRMPHLPSSSSSKYVSTCIDPCVVVLQFESSSSWPTTAEAIATAKMGFYVHLAHALASHPSHAYTCDVFASGLDVAADGFVFRIVIHCEREKQPPRTTSNMISTPPSIPLDLPRATAHASMIHALQTRHVCFAPIVRFVRNWLRSQLCLPLLSLETTELIVASLFTSPSSSSSSSSSLSGYHLHPPQSILSGFFRFLLLVAKHSWHTTPLIVDLNPDNDSGTFLTEADHREIQKRFDASATNAPSTHPAFFVVASYERQLHMAESQLSQHASAHVVDPHMAQRLVALTTACAKRWVSWLQEGAIPRGWQRCFAHATDDYDVVLHIATDVLPPTKGGPSKKGPWSVPYYKNINIQQQQLHPRPHLHNPLSSLWIGISPLLPRIVAALQAHLSHVALVFADDANVIAIRWKPAAFLPSPFRVMKSTHMLPMDDDSGLAVPHIFSLLAEIRALTHGVVECMQVN